MAHMVEFVLNSLALGYRPLWNVERQLAGVQLFLQAEPDSAPDLPHLLRIMQEMWVPQAPRLLLSAQSPPMLQALLTHGHTFRHGAIAVPDEDWQGEASDLVTEAAARGVALVWQGSRQRLPTALASGYFSCGLLRLQSPAAAGLPQHQIWEQIPTQALLHQALDGSSAHSVAGWPAADVLLQLRRGLSLPPSHSHLRRLLEAIQTEQSLDSFETIIGQDPVLAYRLMLYVNSAAVGARSPIDSLQRALAMLGDSNLQAWLTQEMLHSSQALNLLPVRQSMVQRAQLTARLLDAGVSEALHNEVYLCGLFAQLDQVLSEPLPELLQRLPLSERITQAAVLHQGPYAPSLLLATALEQPDGGPQIRALCAEHDISLEHVNRTLLRQIGEWR